MHNSEADQRSEPTGPKPLTRTRRLTRTKLMAAAIPVVLIGIAGCSGSDVAAKQACAAQSDVSESYDSLIADVKAGNFGDAKDELDTLGAALTDLEAQEQKLDSSKEQEIQVEIDKLKSTLSSIGDVKNLEDLGRVLDESGSQFQAIIDAASSAADC